MKKIAFLICLLFLGIQSSLATDRIASLECHYNPKKTSGVTNEIRLSFGVYLNDDNDNVKSWRGLKTKASGSYRDDLIIIDRDKNPNFNEIMFNKLFIENDGKCPTQIYACMAANDNPDNFGWQRSWWVVVAINSEYNSLIYPGGSYYSSGDDDTYYIDDKKNECQKYYLDTQGFDLGDVSVDFNECGYLIKKINVLNSYYEVSEYTKYKKVKDEINSFCGNALNNFDYMYSDNSVDACVDTCLNLDDYIISEEIYNYSKCGFSDKLVIWISNIIRWIKYIIPIAVILLGIVDFIKAIAGDKDDEMKKAQGRFVKRLIAASLIFLTPIIIEFILDKMGFIANDCGIIDL